MKVLLLALPILAVGVAGVIVLTRSSTRSPTPTATLADPQTAVRHSAVVTKSSTPSSVGWQIETPDQRRQRSLDFTREFYVDIGEALGLDAADERQFLEWLTDQNVQPRRANPVEALETFEARVDERLAALLGPQGPQRFGTYFQSLQARRAISRLNEHLGTNDQIRGASKEQLIALVHTGTRPESEGWLPPSFQVVQPEAVRSTIIDALIDMASREDYFRLQVRSHRRMEREAAKFLTPVQFEAFTRTHVEEDDSWRKGLESDRKEAGLEPSVPDDPEDTFGGALRGRVPLAGDVSFALTLTIDRQPTNFKHTGPNRKTVGFQAAHDVWVEAVPVLYDDRWLDMYLTCHEPARTGRRPLEQTVRIGTQTMLAGTPAAPHDAVPETLKGRHTYQIQATGITAQQTL